MPIYEFFCPDCNTIFNFFSRTVNTEKKPPCPKCHNPSLTRQVSMFAFTGKAKESGDDDMDLPIDESRMAQAMQMLEREAAGMDENDPRKAADLMRRLSDMTGIGLGGPMEEALARMERGEDPEQIEAEMGDLMEGEEPFILPDKKGGRRAGARPAPSVDETLYDL